jgi:hypothetical protein
VPLDWLVPHTLKPRCLIQEPLTTNRDASVANFQDLEAMTLASFVSS